MVELWPHLCSRRSKPYTKEYAGVDVMCLQRNAVLPDDKVRAKSASHAPKAASRFDALKLSRHIARTLSHAITARGGEEGVREGVCVGGGDEDVAVASVAS